MRLDPHYTNKVLILPFLMFKNVISHTLYNLSLSNSKQILETIFKKGCLYKLAGWIYEEMVWN